MFFKTHIRWVKVISEFDFKNQFKNDVIRPLDLEGLEVLAVNSEGQLKVFEKLCPHQKASLNDATCKNGEVICPWHKYGFDLNTGRDLSTAGNALKVYQTNLEDAHWFVGVEVKLPFWMDPA